MPSPQWLLDNPKITAYIPRELHVKLQEYCETSEHRTESQAIGAILREYFSPTEPPSAIASPAGKKLLKAIEQYAAVVGHGPPPQGQNGRGDRSDWLTVGEAFAVARSRGFTKSIKTFRRAIAMHPLTPELQALGLQLDWVWRQTQNPKDNTCRWLKFDEGG